MTTEAANIVSQCKSAVTQLYGERLAKLILFGSYARGEEKESSDIDFLVVLKDKKISAFTEIERINDKVYDLMIQHGKIITFVPTTFDNFHNSPNLLYSLIKKEGREV
jgi:uncharacterized protein